MCPTQREPPPAIDYDDNVVDDDDVVVDDDNDDVEGHDSEIDDDGEASDLDTSKLSATPMPEYLKQRESWVQVTWSGSR